MPYIDDRARRSLELTGMPRNAGELNYTITRLVLARGDEAKPAIENAIARYAIRQGGASYATYNDIMGVLLCVGFELVRRGVDTDPVLDVLTEIADDYYFQVIGPYEDRKITENGDLPGFPVRGTVSAAE